MRKKFLYKILLPLDKIIMKLYRVEYKNKEFIPKKGRIILAGNHTSKLDALLLMSSTNRCIHFLAKIELFKGIKKHFFSNLGLIPVDRNKRNPEVIKKATEYLHQKEVIGIFPEGTINRTNNIIIPFKRGAVIIASESDSEILPFAITGEYKFLKKGVKLSFGTPYKVTGNKEKDIKILEDKITKLIRSNS